MFATNELYVGVRLLGALYVSAMSCIVGHPNALNMLEESVS